MLPYAFARKQQQICNDSLRWCSVHPGTVDMKAFCRDGLRQQPTIPEEGGEQRRV